MSLNTSIRGIQIKDTAAGNGLEKDGSGDFQLDLKASAGLKIDTGELSIEPADFAGDGLKDDGSDNLALDLNELTAAVVDVANDEIAIVDAGDSSTKKEAIADVVTAIAGVGLSAASGVLAIDLNELTGAIMDVSADYIPFVDATDNSTKVETVVDLVAFMAGSGLTATAGVLSADAVSDNIIEADIQVENESANCNGATTVFNLTSEPMANSVQVFLNGLLQEEGSGKDYTLDTGAKTVTFATAPLTNDILIIHYIIND